MSDKNIRKKIIGILGGAGAFALIAIFVDLVPGKPEVTFTLAIAVLMAIWWVTEAAPIAITSLVPIAFFPLLNIMPSDAVAIKYFNSTIFLYIGGFLMAFAMEKWNLHRRIALKILLFVGISPGRILIGFMLATAFLSMWMSNTATTVMMIPIILSIIKQLEESMGKKNVGSFTIALLLAVAYSATIGGTGTLIGTPPNLVLTEVYKESFPTLPEISFSTWFIFATPLIITMLITTWFLLMMMYKPHKNWKGISIEIYRNEFKKLGKPSYEEKIVFIVFALLAFLWITRAGFKMEDSAIPNWLNNSKILSFIYQFFMSGWSSFMQHPKYFSDGNVAIALAMILFLIPSKHKKGAMIMDWKTANKLPWHIVLLFGGGFALAAGFKTSGLSVYFADQLVVLKGVHPIIIIFCVVFLISFLTELTSNVATTQMFLPVLASLAIATEIDPLLLMIPATVAASLAFMLPIATPPNAIVFGTDRLKMSEMAKTGFFLNMIKIFLTTVFTYFWATKVFDIVIK